MERTFIRTDKKMTHLVMMAILIVCAFFTGLWLGEEEIEDLKKEIDELKNERK